MQPSDDKKGAPPANPPTIECALLSPKGRPTFEQSTQYRLFVFEYLVDMNAARAAQAAGYDPKMAHILGPRLLQVPYVKRLVQEITAARFNSLNITSERVLREVARMAFVDPRKFFNDDGTVREIIALDDDTAAAVAGFEVNEISLAVKEKRDRKGRLVEYVDIPKARVKKIKIADKGENLERLGRHLGLFNQKVEVQHMGTIEHVLSQREQEDARRAVEELRAYDAEIIDVTPREVSE